MSNLVNTTDGVNIPDPSQIPLQGLPPWLVSILQTIPGAQQGYPGTGAATQPSNSGSGWAQYLPLLATIAGAGLNARTQAQRNDLLKQQIQNNQTMSVADQQRRDYYASILMPSILQGLRNRNPLVLGRAQQALNQNGVAPPLSYGSGPTQTLPNPTSAQATPVSQPGNFIQTTAANSSQPFTTFDLNVASGNGRPSQYLFPTNEDQI